MLQTYSAAALVTVCRYLILMTFFIDGDDELGNVRDKLVALGLPQRLHTHFHVLNQHFLRREKEYEDEIWSKF